MAEKPPIKEPTDEEPVDAHVKYRHPILTDAQVDAAKAKALATATKARSASAMKIIEEQEAQRLREEEGISVGGGVLDEMVAITLDLAPDMNYLATNGRRYEHGKSYTVPRSVAQDLLARQYNGHKNEARRLGQDSHAFYQREKSPTIVHVNGSSVAVRHG